MIYTAVSVFDQTYFFLKQLYSNSVSSYIIRYIHTQTVAPVKWIQIQYFTYKIVTRAVWDM